MTTGHIRELIPDPKNARKHTPRNVGMIRDAIHSVGTARSIVVDENNVTLAGNATVEAAAQAGITRVQYVDTDGETIIAVRRKGLTPEQKTKLALFDNRAAELAEWDTEVLAELAEELDLTDLFRTDELADVLAEADAYVADPEAEADPQYSRAIETPVYEITGACPEASSLVSTARTDDLLTRIDAAVIPEEVRTFLRYAAYRHLTFDYAMIAEFYAHAEAEVQELMERSALVIIDVDQAIELGFARLTEELRGIAEVADVGEDVEDLPSDD